MSITLNDQMTTNWRNFNNNFAIVSVLLKSNDFKLIEYIFLIKFIIN